MSQDHLQGLHFGGLQGSSLQPPLEVQDVGRKQTLVGGLPILQHQERLKYVPEVVFMFLVGRILESSIQIR